MLKEKVPARCRKSNCTWFLFSVWLDSASDCLRGAFERMFRGSEQGMYWSVGSPFFPLSSLPFSLERRPSIRSSYRSFQNWIKGSLWTDLPVGCLDMGDNRCVKRSLLPHKECRELGLHAVWWRGSFMLIAQCGQSNPVHAFSEHVHGSILRRKEDFTTSQGRKELHRKDHKMVTRSVTNQQLYMSGSETR